LIGLLAGRFNPLANLLCPILDQLLKALILLRSPLTELPSKPTPKARLTGFEGLLHLLLILLRSDGPSCLENVSLERIARGTSLIHQRHSRLTSGLCLLLFGSGSTLRETGGLR